MRESPAVPIVNQLLTAAASVQAFDPVARHEAEKIFRKDRLVFAETLDAAIEGAQAILLLTRWPEFEQLPKLLARLPVQPLLIDGRRMLDKLSVSRYEGIGLNPTRTA
jgi:UDPglucose 6-dehydrogenase/GDP-mannose 6-dehydrogenase